MRLINNVRKDQNITFALVTEAFHGRGGIAQYNRDFFSALNQNHKIITYIFPRRSSRATYSARNLYQLPSKLNKYIYVIKSIIYALKLQPNVVYCGHLHMIFLCYIISTITRSKLICQLHGIELPKKLGRVSKFCINKSDIILSVSEHTRKQAQSLLGVTNVNFELIHNTVSDKFEILDTDQCRSRVGLNLDLYYILTVARLDASQKHKGHETVIRSLPALLSLNPNVHYLIAGEGDDEERLRSLVHQLNVQHAVTFLGYVPSVDLPVLYNACDLFAMPSTGEGFGIVFLEAMACGLTTIGLSVAGAADPLRLSGYTCTNDQQFTKEVIAIVKEGRREKDPTLRARVLAQFSSSKLEERVMNLFDTLLRF